MTQKQNAPTSRKTSESATQTQTTGADSTQLQMFTAQAMADKSEKVRDSDKPAKPLKFTPRELRVIDTMQRKEWTPREEIDRVAGASNGPAVIAGIRAKLGADAVEMRRVDATDRDGNPCKPGQYRLTEQGRARLAEMGGL